MELPSFTQDQVHELTLRYGLAPAEPYAEQVLDLVGGNPYLTQLALFHLSQQMVSVKQLTENAIGRDRIFSSHLRQQLGYLEQHPDLLASMKQVIHSPEGTILHPKQAFRLQGLGLLRFQNQRAISSCQLYQRYFAQVLNN